MLHLDFVWEKKSIMNLKLTKIKAESNKVSLTPKILKFGSFTLLFENGNGQVCFKPSENLLKRISRNGIRSRLDSNYGCFEIIVKIN